MLLGKPFAAFIDKSPISVMVSGTLERVFEPTVLDQIFQDHAILGYAKELTFSQCVQIMSDVVFKESPSVGAYYQAHPDEIPVTRQAVYNKLKRLEPQVPAALVHYSAEELLPCVKAMGSQAPPLLPRYRVRVLDGNHLAGTEHRIFELRRFRAAVLPGQALVFYDPRFDLMTDVIPCEDAYAQERSLLDQALNCISARDCILADRNFCTTGFLFGIRRRGAFFVIRQHASTLSWELSGKTPLGGTGWSRAGHLRTSDSSDRPQDGRNLHGTADYHCSGQAHQGRRNGVAHSHQPAAESGRRGADCRSLLRPLDDRNRLPAPDRRSAVRDRHFGLSQGGAVWILHGVCGVQRGVGSESGDSRGTGQEVRGRRIVDVLPHLGSVPNDCWNDGRHPGGELGNFP